MMIASGSAYTTIIAHHAGISSYPEIDWADRGRIYDILCHMAEFRRDEDNIRQQQHGIILSGAFLLPSPYGDHGDRCIESWIHEFQFYYKFVGQSGEIYFWVTGLLDRAYSLDTLWFPARKLAFTLHASQMDGERLQRFEQSYDYAADKDPALLVSGPGSCCAVFGFPHFMHTLWNEMPAIMALSGLGLPPGFRLALLLEPFGPMRELFPGLAPHMMNVSSSTVTGLNTQYPLLVGLGSSTIPGELQAVIQDVSARLLTVDERAEAGDVARAYRNLFWISVKPPKRTVIGQEDFLAFLITRLSRTVPGAGFVINGASSPWDLSDNPNYDEWFKSRYRDSVDQSGEIIDRICALLPDDIRASIHVLNDVPVCREIIWACSADFYVCHGGTMQNKIGWTTMVPGIVHSSSAFLAAINYTLSPVVDGDVALMPADLVIDDAVNSYTPLELARKDKNYAFASSEQVVTEVLAAYRSALIRRAETIMP